MNFFQELLLSEEFKGRFSELVNGIPHKRKPRGFVTARRFMESPFTDTSLDEPFEIGNMQFEKEGYDCDLSSVGMGALDGNFDSVYTFMDAGRFIERDTLENYLYFIHDRRTLVQESGGVITNPLLLIVRPGMENTYNVMAIQDKKDLAKLTEEELDTSYTIPGIRDIVDSSLNKYANFLKKSGVKNVGLLFSDVVAGFLSDTGRYNANTLVWSKDSNGFESEVEKLRLFDDSYSVDLGNVRETIDFVRYDGVDGDKGPKPTK